MRRIMFAGSLGLAALAVSCDQGQAPAATGPAVDRAICVLRGTAGNAKVRGVVKFTKEAGGVRIRADVTGLTPGKHGFHIHQWGNVDCADGKCAGGHFNPSGSKHGGPDAVERHAGDLGNLEADADGHASYDRTDHVIGLGGPTSILGRAIIVHAGADDLTSQPTGAAGARVAYGVIGIAK